jgi:hypothetical protein
MEKHRELQPHVQKLLGSVEIARCEKRHTSVQLGIRQRTIHKAQIVIPRRRVKDVLTELHDGPSGGHFEYQQNVK